MVPWYLSNSFVVGDRHRGALNKTPLPKGWLSLTLPLTRTVENNLPPLLPLVALFCVVWASHRIPRTTSPLFLCQCREGDLHTGPELRGKEAGVLLRQGGSWPRLLHGCRTGGECSSSQDWMVHRGMLLPVRAARLEGLVRDVSKLLLPTLVKHTCPPKDSLSISPFRSHRRPLHQFAPGCFELR